MNANVNEYDENGFCPYCGSENFDIETQVISVPEFEDVSFLNTCNACSEQSISNNNKQYKIQ